MVLGKNYLKENVVGFDCDVGGVQEDARQIVLAEWGCQHRGLHSLARFLGFARYMKRMKVLANKGLK